MAELEVENPDGFIDKRRGRGVTTAGLSNGTTSVQNVDSVGSLRARLTAINSTSYSAARLNSMTRNDMLYAVRLNDEAAGLA